MHAGFSQTRRAQTFGQGFWPSIRGRGDLVGEGCDTNDQGQEHCFLMVPYRTQHLWPLWRVTGASRAKRPGWYLAADMLWRYPVWQGALTKGGVLCSFPGHRRLPGKPQPALFKERGNQRGQELLSLLENSRGQYIKSWRQDSLS